MEKENEKKGFDIELPQEVSEGIFSNLAIITHSNSEFIIDFIRVMPGVPKPKVKSRIVMTPQHAKRLRKALDDNIKKFESNIGEIIAPEEENRIPIDMFGKQGQA